MKALLLLALVALAASRSYPLYKQCDSKWGGEQLGTSSNTICKAGCLMSSVSMALAAIGKGYNPGTLNTWLKGHGGYVSGDLFVWGSVSSLGLSYVGKVADGQIGSNVNANNVVVINVHGGAHWVLVTSVSGNTLNVNDPGFNTNSYTISEIVSGNSGLYRVSGSFLGIMIDELEFLLNVNNRREVLKEAAGGLLAIQ
ncbi:unnamed protein product [Sphagnum balticum]